MGFRSVGFPPACHSGYGASDSYPGGTDSRWTHQPFLDAQRSMHLSAHYALRRALECEPVLLPWLMRPWQGGPAGAALVRLPWPGPILCITQTARPRPPLLACTPSPRLHVRFLRFAPAVKPAPGVLRVLRRHNPLVGLAPRRRSRVPTQLTSEDGLGVPFAPLRL